MEREPGTRLTIESLAKISLFLLTRIMAAGFLVYVGLAAVAMLHISLSEHLDPKWESASMLVYVALSILVAHLIYRIYVHYVEKRPMDELSGSSAPLELLAGVGIGGGLIGLSVGILWLSGLYTIDTLNDWPMLYAPIHLQTALYAGYIEELLFRGIIFRITEEKLGTRIALGIQAVLFGFMHGWNPNSTLFSLIAISLEAGILLGAAFAFTRRLWLAIGIHTAWNYVQGAVFGIPVSGYAVKGFFSSKPVGPELLTGGAFGVEASIVTLLICTTAGVFMLVKARQKGRLIEPFWAQQHV
ncbi:MAG: CPBP family intramembrane metalloprotease [Chlorobiales bacterium]|nr:CPBP family intramembrane metalloprotease [Chlorobiales bacterium]